MFDLKRLIVGTFLAGCTSMFPVSAAVFVVAHPDDHILLMGPNLVNDIINGYPTVIVIVTAGDAGNGIGAYNTESINSGRYNNLGRQYYRVRLRAQMEALDSWIPDPNNHVARRPWAGTEEYFSSAAPRVERWSLGNVVLYHLNLPDQYDSNGHTKLENLAAGTVMTLSDIRGINTYTPASLRVTLRQIISRNNHNTPNLVINYHAHVNDNRDHRDHTAAGKLVYDAIAEAPAYGCMWQAIYPGYALADIAVNYPNLLDRQRAGYEIAHRFLLQRGNITPISGGKQANPNWAQTTPFYPRTDLQKGTMDAFHTSFYGKSSYTGDHPSNVPCKL